MKEQKTLTGSKTFVFREEAHILLGSHQVQVFRAKPETNVWGVGEVGCPSTMRQL